MMKKSIRYFKVHRYLAILLYLSKYQIIAKKHVSTFYYIVLLVFKLEIVKYIFENKNVILLYST